ncbi:hypothetical protein Sm713_40800 [Streptomyces sp. TS71-3]|nr:hypothetical protein Sm713_40800 [Streptomyces sp. TS71-3]
MTFHGAIRFSGPRRPVRSLTGNVGLSDAVGDACARHGSGVRLVHQRSRRERAACGHPRSQALGARPGAATGRGAPADDPGGPALQPALPTGRRHPAGREPELDPAVPVAAAAAQALRDAHCPPAAARDGPAGRTTWRSLSGVLAL